MRIRIADPHVSGKVHQNAGNAPGRRQKMWEADQSAARRFRHFTAAAERRGPATEIGADRVVNGSTSSSGLRQERLLGHQIRRQDRDGVGISALLAPSWHVLDVVAGASDNGESPALATLGE